MPNLVAIASADFHLHPFSAFAKERYSRFEVSLRVVDFLFKKAEKASVPLLFAGDLFHNPKEVSNYVITQTINAFEDWTKLNNFIAISGNHDQEENNTRNNISPTYLSAFNHIHNFNSIDNGVWANSKIVVAGVPYYKDEEFLLEKIKQANGLIKDNYDGFKILMLHGDLPGCPNPAGYVVDDVKYFPKKIDKLWPNFDLVISGHIHKPWRASKKAYMLGSPIHQNETDIGCEMGYWEIYSDAKPKLIPLTKKFPQFIKIPWDAEPLPDNEKDYIVKGDKPEEEDDESLQGKFDNKLDSKTLTRRYLKAKGIKSKSKRELLINLLAEAKNL